MGKEKVVIELARRLRVLKVKRGGELDDLIKEADEWPLLLEREGKRYRLAPEEDIWADYDPRGALDGIRAAAGSWRDVDAEALKARVYRARAEGTRPRL